MKDFSEKECSSLGELLKLLRKLDLNQDVLKVLQSKLIRHELFITMRALQIEIEEQVYGQFRSSFDSLAGPQSIGLSGISEYLRTQDSDSSRTQK